MDEKYVFFVVFIDLEGLSHLPTYPQGGSKSSSSLLRFLIS